MKKILIAMTALLAFATIATAQARGFAMADAQTANEVLSKIEGKLSLINGEIGVKVKDKTYYLAMPRNLFGFIEGLKEGSQVKLEGYERSDSRTPDYAWFRVAKLSFNGKDYDLSQSYGPGGMGKGSMMDGRGTGPTADGQGRGAYGQGRGSGNRR